MLIGITIEYHTNYFTNTLSPDVESSTHKLHQGHQNQQVTTDPCIPGQVLLLLEVSWQKHHDLLNKTPIHQKQFKHILIILLSTKTKFHLLGQVLLLLN